MTSPYNLFKEKKIDITSPTVLDYGDFKIHIVHGGVSNKTFINAAQMQLKPFERREQLKAKGAMSQEGKESLEKDYGLALANLYANHIIVGWEDVVDQDAQEIEYNKDNVVKVLTDLPLLFKDIIEQASDSSNFKEIEEEEDSKN